MTFKPRHFAHKIVFGRTKSMKSQELYKNSVYYYWYEFLKRSDNYKKCCKSKGKDKLSELFKDFGDVFNNDFKTWWKENDRGVNLFAEELYEKPTFKELVKSNDMLQSDEIINIQVPLTLPKRFLTQQFHKLLKSRHTGTKGKRFNEISTARYPITSRYSIQSLKIMLRIYDYKLNNPKAPLWKIGKDCKVMIQEFDVKTKKDYVGADLNKVSNAVHRYLKKAKCIIQNVERGKFPIMTNSKK